MTGAHDTRPSILITGAAGGLAGIVAELLVNRYRLVGVDGRRMPAGRNFPGVFHQIGYTQRKMADVFRANRFDAMLHLGRVPVTSARASERYNVNVLGTRNLLEQCLRYGVKNVVVCSTFHVYGAHQHNHLHMSEEDPLRASQTFPELADAVELDHSAMTFMLRHSEIRTVVLRPVNVIGPRVKNQISNLLRGDYCPVLLGYDPMLQFVHERDVAYAVELALESDHRGVYNVSGEGVVPYTKAVRIAGAVPIPVPRVLAYGAAGMISRFSPSFPKHLIDYFRFPAIVSDQAFRSEFGYRPRVTTLEALKSVRARVGAFS